MDKNKKESTAAARSPVWLLNAPVITAEGLFRSQAVSVAQASRLVHCNGFESAIGHAQTAALLSSLLGINCPMRRIAFHQQPGQQALVLRLASRLAEGQVLHGREEIEAVGYSLLLITREA